MSDKVLCFVDDDGGYLNWLAANPDGFVVNTFRKPTPTYLRLHHACCPTIRELPIKGGHWTATTLKVCGSQAELESWARNAVGGEPTPCPRCT